MFQNASRSRYLRRANFDVFFPIKSAINGHLNIGTPKFDLKIFIVICEKAMPLLCGNEHGMSFHNIPRKFVSIQSLFYPVEVAVNSLIQMSAFVRLMENAGDISIHGNI